MRELGWRDESERICQFSEASFLHPVFCIQFSASSFRWPQLWDAGSELKVLEVALA